MNPYSDHHDFQADRIQWLRSSTIGRWRMTRNVTALTGRIVLTAGERNVLHVLTERAWLFTAASDLPSQAFTEDEARAWATFFEVEDTMGLSSPEERQHY